MTAYLLDTNVCIAFALGRSAALLARMTDARDRMAMSAVTYAELQVGARASPDPEGDRRALDRLVQFVPVLPFAEIDAVAYGRLARIGGIRRASFDRVIAAQAIAAGRTLITANLRDFADIPGLLVEDWTA